MLHGLNRREAQAHLNITALLRLHSLQTDIWQVAADRVWFSDPYYSAGSFGAIYSRLQFELTPGKFGRDDLNLRRNHPSSLGETASCGWREDAVPSLQIIRHRVGADGTIPLGGEWRPQADGQFFCYEADVDIYPWKRDVVSWVGHVFGEVLWHKIAGGKTDPFRIRRLLEKKRGITVPGLPG
jgi:hypothetical protein